LRVVVRKSVKKAFGDEGVWAEVIRTELADQLAETDELGIMNPSMALRTKIRYIL
jgi:hypothetical protein